MQTKYAFRLVEDYLDNFDGFGELVYTNGRGQAGIPIPVLLFDMLCCMFNLNMYFSICNLHVVPVAAIIVKPRLSDGICVAVWVTS